MNKKNKEALLEAIVLDRLIARERRAGQATPGEPAQPRPLLPGLAALESALAAYLRGAMQQRDDQTESVATLFVTAVLQGIGLLAADRSSLAPHAEAVATGLLSVSAYRAGLAARDAAKRRPPK